LGILATLAAAGRSTGILLIAAVVLPPLTAWAAGAVMTGRAEQLRNGQLIRGARLQRAQFLRGVVDLRGIDDPVMVHIECANHGGRRRALIAPGTAILALRTAATLRVLALWTAATLRVLAL
jgi:hypothetical protein